jgi:hypothetical protein
MGRPKAGQAPKGESEEAKFRICRYKVGLTWSCPKDAEENPIFEELGKDKETVCHAIQKYFQEKYGKADYIVAQEDHESGKKHYHAHFKFYEKLDVTDPLAFDLCGVHPNILNPGKGWPGYCAKHGQFVTNFYEAEPFSEALRQESAEAAAELLWTKRPREMCIHGQNIVSNLQNRLGSKKFKKFEPKPEWQSWENLWPWQQKHWDFIHEDPKCRRIFVVGPARHVGKSQYITYLQAKYEYGVYDLGAGSLSKNDALARYNGEGLVVLDLPLSFDWEKMGPHVETLLEMFANTWQTVDSKKYKGGQKTFQCHVTVFSNRVREDWVNLEHKELVYIDAKRPLELKEGDDREPDCKRQKCERDTTKENISAFFGTNVSNVLV